MRARRNSQMSVIVALAWVQGHIDNVDVRAALGMAANEAGTRLLNGVRGGYLQLLPGPGRKRWGLTPARAEAIASMPCQLELRTMAVQLQAKVQRVRKLQVAVREQRLADRRAALANVALARKEAKAAARAQAKAATKAARQAAKARVLREPTAGQRPPSLPGTRLVAAPPAGSPPGVQVQDTTAAWRNTPVQDPKGLLAPRAQAAAPIAPVLMRGGPLAPADGPYIRPGGLAHLAAPSRRCDALVAHRPPLSKP